MNICTANIYIKELEKTITYQIVTDKAEQKLRDDPIKVHTSSYFADYLFKAITEHLESFVCNNNTFIIIHVDTDDRFNDYNPYYRRCVDFTNGDGARQKVYIYHTSAKCPKCKVRRQAYNIEQVSATVVAAGDKFSKVIVDIQYCKICKIYFIEEQSLKLYERKYGVLLFERVDFYSEAGAFEYGMFSQDSVLSRNGYIAQLDKQSTATRQRIITYIIESGKADKYEIKDILSNLIVYRGDKCYKALPLWRQDLIFVNNYDICSQRYIGEIELLGRS